MQILMPRVPTPIPSPSTALVIGYKNCVHLSPIQKVTNYQRDHQMGNTAKEERNDHHHDQVPLMALNHLSLALQGVLHQSAWTGETTGV